MCAITSPEQAQIERGDEVVGEKLKVSSGHMGQVVAAPAQGDPSSMNQDILAYVTHKHRRAVEYVSGTLDSLFTTVPGRILTRTTQPAHLVAVTAVLIVAYMFVPAGHMNYGRAHNPSPAINMFYIASVSIHLGTQFWMTFVSGLALYFALPRHVFGDVQRVLFPKYFTLNSILSVITLVSFSKLHRGLHWETRHWVQMWCTGICFLVEVFIRLYVVPIVLNLISAKTAMEKKIPGCGQEIGRHEPGQLAKCPHYNKLHMAFRKQHLVVALGNVTTMVCTVLQLHYINQNWSCIL